MVQLWSVRRLLGISAVVLVLIAALAVYVAERAGADVAHCRQAASDSRERASLVSGAGTATVVIGDSWSVGLGLVDQTTSWPSRLSGQVRVAAFSGSGFSAGASACRNVSFAQRAPAAASDDPALVIVQGGLNDYDQGTDAIERGYRSLMRALADRLVVVVGPAAAPARAGAVPRVDALLERLSRAYAVPYVPTSDLSLSYLDDQLHLTPEGHREFGDAVAERLDGVAPSRPRVPR